MVGDEGFYVGVEEGVQVWMRDRKGCDGGEGGQEGEDQEVEFGGKGEE